MIKTLIIILLLLYIYFIIQRKEGFSVLDENSFIRMNPNIMDSFYTKIYDELYNTIDLHKNELYAIKPYIHGNNRLLCFGSRLGHIVQLSSGICETEGLEMSTSMINTSKQKYPKLTFTYGQYDNIHLYNQNTFTSIMVPIMIIHFQDDLSNFFNICYHWLIHNGLLFISYLKDIHNIKYIVNYEPQPKFSHNYKFSIEINNSIINEIIMKKNKLYRKNIWNYSSINLENLIYHSTLKGFNFVDEKDLGFMNIAIFKKKN